MPDLLSCPTCLCWILAPKKVVERRKENWTPIFHVWWLTCTLSGDNCESPINKHAWKIEGEGDSHQWDPWKIANTSKEYKNDEEPPERFQQFFLWSHLLTILDRILEAYIQLYCLLQISMVVIFVQCIHKGLLAKWLASACGVWVDSLQMVFLVEA